LEPVVGSIYMAPEAHAAFAALGFDPSPGVLTEGWMAEYFNDVEMPDYIAYFCSRGAMLGQVPGEVIAATFGVFNPAAVVEAVTAGQKVADADTLWAAREGAAIAQLTRILGEAPEGLERATELLARAGERLTVFSRPMYAGLLARGVPEHPIGRMRALAEQLREFRGDAHMAAFTTAGYDGCEFQVLHERASGLPPKSYALTRSWSEADIDDADARLTARGLLEGGQPTERGFAVREEVEMTTDALCMSMIEALDGDEAELIGRLADWTAKVRAANGYYAASPQDDILLPQVREYIDRCAAQVDS
jgi:hypothetical protein